MDNEVLFECDYQMPASCSSMLLFYSVCTIFMLAAISDGGIVLMPLFMFFMLLRAALYLFEASQHYCTKIQLLPDAVRVRNEDGKILRCVSLIDVVSVRVQKPNKDKDPDTIELVKNSPNGITRVTEKFNGVARAQDFADAVTQQLARLHSAPFPQKNPQPQPMMPLPVMRQPVLSETEINEFRAAEHLVQQGRISPEQLAGMYSQPEPQQAQRLSQDEINARNAAAYMQRQEMLAQQLGSAPVNDAQMKQKENGNHERTGFI